MKNLKPTSLSKENKINIKQLKKIANETLIITPEHIDEAIKFIKGEENKIEVNKGRLDSNIIVVYENDPHSPNEIPLFTFQVLFKEVDYTRLNGLPTAKIDYKLKGLGLTEKEELVAEPLFKSNIPKGYNSDGEVDPFN